MVETWEVKEKLQFVKVYDIEGLDNYDDNIWGYFYPPILIPF